MPASPLLSRPSRKSSTTTTSTSNTNLHPPTEVIINVYDLLPPGPLSTLLWTLGSSLLHSGVVLHANEYAYGGHPHPHISGVYSTPPLHEPPGGRFKTSIHVATIHLPQSEIEGILKSASEKFLGTGYNLLSKNCNHFTNYLVKELTGKSAPRWLNRAAGLAGKVPCVVPREWVDAGESDEEGERTAMIGPEGRRGSETTTGERVVTVTDSSGRVVPVAERAPLGRRDRA